MNSSRRSDVHISDDFLEYYNSNVDGTDRSEDDAIGKIHQIRRAT